MEEPKTTAQQLRLRYETETRAQAAAKEQAIAGHVAALTQCLTIHVKDAFLAGSPNVLLRWPEKNVLSYAQEVQTCMRLPLNILANDTQPMFQSVWQRFEAIIKANGTQLLWEDLYDHDNDFCECRPREGTKGCQHRVRLSLRDLEAPTAVDQARLMEVAVDMVVFVVDYMGGQATRGHCDEKLTWATWMHYFARVQPRHTIFLKYAPDAALLLLCTTVGKALQTKHGFHWMAREEDVYPSKALYVTISF